MKEGGIRQTIMLTGDADAVGQKVASRLGLDKAYTELLPADKVDRVEAVSYTHLDVYKRQAQNRAEAARHFCCISLWSKIQNSPHNNGGNKDSSPCF